MAPVTQSEVDLESRTSEMASQDSPLRRQFSEPIQAHSTSTQASPSPSPIAHKSKCAWCGMYFESSGDESISSNEALKKHIATVHPHIAKFSMYDDPGDDDDDDDDDEHFETEDMASPNEHGSRHTVELEGDDNIVEGAEATELYDENEKGVADLNGEEPEAEAEVEVPEGESDRALSNQLHEFSREQDSVSLEKRLHNFWNIHNVRNFSDDYDAKTTSIGKTWTAVFHESKRLGKKRDAPELSGRPDPYKKPKVGRGEFLEITPLEDFLSQLRDPELRSIDELYAITENVSYTLKAWQDEYLAIDKLQKLATRHQAKATSDPRKFERPQVFEDKKEAMLYGYKHDPKEDKVGNQNPFVQGGFKPTPAQFRKMTAKAGPNNPNPDGWPTILKFNVEHVPKFQNPPREEFVGKATRKRKAAEMEAANKANETEEVAEKTPTPAEPDQDDINAVKRRTRTRRQTTEVELVEPGPKGSVRGRGGRARGRGGARAGSRAASEAPLTPVPATTVAPSRSASARQATDVSQTHTGTSQLVPIEPAPSGSAAAVSTADPQEVGAQDESFDAAELARRQKIANSKNPKRTEAMLNHWARFNREGRVRNPKRSKAQIEADRVAEAARKAAEPPKIIGKKKKSTSPVIIGPPRPDPGLALAPAPPAMTVPTPLAPGPHTQPPQLAPIAAARGPLAPYPPPMDPRAVVSFPPPRGPLQPPPPQPYHTPYPDYYIPYGAAAGLPPHPPPPGHPRPA
ncbi:hypothetical protein ARAM_002471 [Aspergillus rambellii]|uniref:Uncharacterized protein n=1 Tax=Aspergillus rambellii TaxID=308745 RepID=A0A0F8V2G5_9EURO|nr:hypothetical protein ARAM_002471 [Aspergillus rambellii]